MCQHPNCIYGLSWHRFVVLVSMLLKGRNGFSCFNQSQSFLHRHWTHCNVHVMFCFVFFTFVGVFYQQPTRRMRLRVFYKTLRKSLFLCYTELVKSYMNMTSCSLLHSLARASKVTPLKSIHEGMSLLARHPQCPMNVHPLATTKCWNRQFEKPNSPLDVPYSLKVAVTNLQLWMLLSLDCRSFIKGRGSV